jgi:hypothetical protein
MSKMDATASERHNMHLTPNRFPTFRLWGKISTRRARGESRVARPSLPRHCASEIFLIDIEISILVPASCDTKV